jgi:hypothetical protein
LENEMERAFAEDFTLGGLARTGGLRIPRFGASKDLYALGALAHAVLRSPSDPRFAQILRDVGLVDYWCGSGTSADPCHPVGDSFECR